MKRSAAVVAALLLAAPLLAQAPPGCDGSARLGTFRILVRRAPGTVAFPLKSVSAVPAGAVLIWDPVHLPYKHADSAEVAAILVPDSGDDLVVLEPRKAGAPAEWRIAVTPSAIALVLGPQGLSAGKVKSLVTHDRELVEQLADYADQTSKVESLVQELSDAQQSGGGADSALRGFSTLYGVTLPKLDAKTSTDQQASLLLKGLLPTASKYDPLSSNDAQMQQSAGLAASVAGLFFGNAVGIAAGGSALFQGIKGALFPDTEFRSAFAQNDKNDGLALCTKAQAQKPRTRSAYLWAYRVPNIKAPAVSLAGPVNVLVGCSSSVGITAARDSSVKPLERARDWRLVPLSGGAPEPVSVRISVPPESLELDLVHTKAKPGDYRLAATWDWDPLDITGTLRLHPAGNLGTARMGAGSGAKLIEGNGSVTVEVSGADFEFLEKAAVVKVANRPAKPVETRFVLPAGKREGVQHTVTVDIDTAKRGDYALLLTQSGGHTASVPFTVLPPNPVLSGLPVHVNRDDTIQPLRLSGTGLERIESVSSDAGEISGSAEGGGWTGTVRLKQTVPAGSIFAVSLKVKGLDSPIAIANGIRVFGPRPVITAIKTALPDALGLALHPGELPEGTNVGLSMEIRQFEDSSGRTSNRPPTVEVGCQSGGLRKSLRAVPGERAAGATLTATAPGLLFLSIDPGSVGYPGCILTAAVDVEPEGVSDPVTIGRVIRIPHLEQFTLTNEQIASSTYVGFLKGRDLDAVEKIGWDAHQGLRIDSVPTPMVGDPSMQTIRVALPWPAPEPHAPLYVWLRGEEEGRKTSVSY